MAGSDGDRSCSICGHALGSSEEWIALDGGEVWCADCWQQHLIGSSGASGKRIEPAVQDEDLQLLSYGEDVSQGAGIGVSRPCMNCGHLCAPDAVACPSCGGEPAPAVSQTGPPGTEAATPATEQSVSSGPHVSVSQGHILASSGGGVPTVHQINIGQPTAATDLPKTSGLAIASLVLSLVGIFVLGMVLGSLAVVFGAVALNAIGKDPKLKGRGLAIAGLVIGIADVAISALVLAMFWGRFATAGPGAWWL